MRVVDFSLYLITDRNLAPGGLVNALEGALGGGARCVQLREKDLSARELLELAKKVRALTRRFGARLLVNDRADVALAVDADGVHLGGEGFSPKDARRLLGDERLIGASTHSIDEARRAEEEGADFIVSGPVYATPSKARYGAPIGVEALKIITASVKIPVFALGGIKKENAREALSAGARGVALISGIIASPDPEGAAREMLSELGAVG